MQSELNSELTDEQREEVVEILTRLEADAHKGGWDQPAQLWTVYMTDGKLHYSNRDDIFKFTGGGHPAEILETMYEMGARLHPDARALVIVTEGYRHRTLEETRESPVDDDDRKLVAAVDAIYEMAKSDLGEAKAKELIRSAQERAMLDAPRPSQMPAAKRREMRMVTAVLQNGWSTTISRTRESDEILSGVWMTPDETRGGRVPVAMLQLLTWDEVRQKSREEISELFARRREGSANGS